MRRYCSLLLPFWGVCTAFGTSIYHSDWIDFNKNGERDAYEIRTLPIEERVDDLLSQMTLEEKMGQLVTLYGYDRVLADPLPTAAWKASSWAHGVANIDEHLNNSLPNIRGGATREYSFPWENHLAAKAAVQRWFIESTRLGIPVDFSNEGIRGLCHDRATAFPAQIGVGATWNPELVEAIGSVVGREARALGYTNVYAPILDLPRDPRWGRIVECYGEDPFLVGQYGKAMVEGIQRHGIVATAKHFAVYGIPKGGRDGYARTDPKVTAREMWELHLEPFRMAFQEAGALGVMSSYNDWNGIPVSSSSYFLTTILRETFGFQGYVVSDSRAVEFPFTKHQTAEDYGTAIRQCLEAGLNVRTNFDDPSNFLEPLRAEIESGRLPMEVVDARVREVLKIKFWMGLFDKPMVAVPDSSIDVRLADHLALSEQAARESLVLLKNEGNRLPLDRSSLRKVLVVGPNADDQSNSISRYGPSNIEVVTVYQGLKQRLEGQAEVVHAIGCELVDARWPLSEILPEPMDVAEQAGIDEAVALAEESDVVVAVLGDNHQSVGESTSRTSLDLTGRQEDLLKALVATGKPVVLVLVNGRPLSINWADRHVDAILEAWFPGEFGGYAVADALLGDYNPGGRLPVTFPKTVGQIPIAFPSKRGSNDGQPQYGANGTGNSRIVGALYPFGHGLSYTSFAYADLKVPEQWDGQGELEVRLTVTNTGARAGDEVVQLYLRDAVSEFTAYDQVLRGFQRVHLEPGASRELVFHLDAFDCSYIGAGMRRVAEAGAFEVRIGSSSENLHLRQSFILNTTIDLGGIPREPVH